MGGTTLQSESGATLRGAGLKEPSAKVKGAQWHRRRRPRAVKPIHDQPKFRWTEELEEIPACPLNRAISIAAKAHAGQLDKAGEAYILHPLRVMMTLAYSICRRSG
jgi:hypothetical protein